MSKAKQLLEEIDQMKLFPDIKLDTNEISSVLTYLTYSRLIFITQVSKYGFEEKLARNIFDTYWKLTTYKRKDIQSSLSIGTKFLEQFGIKWIENNKKS